MIIINQIFFHCFHELTISLSLIEIISKKNFKSLHEQLFKILLTCSRLVNRTIRDITRYSHSC